MNTIRIIEGTSVETCVGDPADRHAAFLIDLLTAKHGTNPPTPDANGVIRRELAEDVAIRSASQLAAFFDRAGFAAEIA